MSIVQSNVHSRSRTEVRLYGFSMSGVHEQSKPLLVSDKPKNRGKTCYKEYNKFYLEKFQPSAFSILCCDLDGKVGCFFVVTPSAAMKKI